jgi:ribose transport system permease protein
MASRKSKTQRSEPHSGATALPGSESRVHVVGREVAEQVSLIVVWGIVILVFGILRPSTFLTLGNFSSIFGTNAVLTVLALGLIVVLRAGDYDLSVAATMTVAAVALGVLTAKHGVPLGLAILITALIGAAVGAVNAFMVLVVGVDSFITTLGMGTLLGGVALWISNNETITGIPQSLVNWVVVRRLFSIPVEFFYAIALMAIIWYLFRYTGMGRRLLFVGQSREVSRLSGIRVGRIRLAAFVVAGAISAMAGVLLAGTSGSADPTSGVSYLLPAYAAAYLGATAIEVGEFNPIGTVVAVYFLVTGVSGLAIVGVPSYVQEIFYGGALILAVAGSHLAAVAKAKRKLVDVNLDSSLSPGDEGSTNPQSAALPNVR